MRALHAHCCEEQAKRCMPSDPCTNSPKLHAGMPRAHLPQVLQGVGGSVRGVERYLHTGNEPVASWLWCRRMKDSKAEVAEKQTLTFVHQGVTLRHTHNTATPNTALHAHLETQRQLGLRRDAKRSGAGICRRACPQRKHGGGRRVGRWRGHGGVGRRVGSRRWRRGEHGIGWRRVLHRAGNRCQEPCTAGSGHSPLQRTPHAYVGGIRADRCARCTRAYIHACMLGSCSSDCRPTLPACIGQQRSLRWMQHSSTG